ncbi:murein hydrolase activator EnvC family protein [Egibacter rhizosphaerae]|nr:M23 family metallopeptidase [Egibacter rhizosphaerae]
MPTHRSAPRSLARVLTRVGLALGLALVLGASASTVVAGDQVVADRFDAEVSGGARPPVDGEVLRGFEPPADPYGPGHRGVALAADPGEPIRAALQGTVTWAGPVAGTGWVTVDHGGGLDTTYGPVEPIAVTEGTRVARGDTLGNLAPGSGELHWGARRNGAYLDPLGLLGRWQPRLVPTEPGPDRRAWSRPPSLVSTAEPGLDRRAWSPPSLVPTAEGTVAVAPVTR